MMTRQVDSESEVFEDFLDASSSIDHTSVTSCETTDDKSDLTASSYEKYRAERKSEFGSRNFKKDNEREKEILLGIIVQESREKVTDQTKRNKRIKHLE